MPELLNALDLMGLSLDEAVAFARELGEPRYRGEQIWRWVHARGARRVEEMTDLPKTLRASLAERTSLRTLKLADMQTSRDGTRKLRLETRDGRQIESVLIPDGDKLTQCISSQVGCALDCQFCATAKMGLGRHLRAGEIVEQVYLARDLLADVEPGRRITNIVYMGMGEPLHNFEQVMRSFGILTHTLGANFSYRRITVSTVGLVPGIQRLAREPVRPNLAISLNASSDAVRDRIMPVNRKYPIGVLLEALRAYPLEPRRRLTFEYVLLAGVNDTPADAARLATLLRPLRCKLNIIPWNPHEEAPYHRPSPAAVEAFQNDMRRRGVAVYLRTPRGDDIDAACGQLARRSQQGRVVPLRRGAPAAR